MTLSGLLNSPRKLLAVCVAAWLLRVPLAVVYVLVGAVFFELLYRLTKDS